MRKTLIREIAEIVDRNIQKRNRMTEAEVRAMAETYKRQREIDKNYYSNINKREQMSDKEKKYKKVEKRLEKMKKEFASIRSELLELGSNEVIFESDVWDFERDVNRYIDRMYDDLYE